MSIVLEVLLANVATRALAIGLAAWLSYKPLAKFADALLGAACGFLIAVSLLHLLPEAFESTQVDAHLLGIAMLATVVAFILLGRFAESGHVHVHGRILEGKSLRRTTAAPILTGAVLHSFVDGLLVASSFMLDAKAGWFVAAAVFIHELPQQMGYLVILKSDGFPRQHAVGLCAFIACFAVLGGMVGCAAIGAAETLMPYALAMSGTSFLYISLFSLLPEVFHFGAHAGESTAHLARASFRSRGLCQCLMLIAGALLAAVLLGFGHGHEHVHAHDGYDHEAHVELRADDLAR